MTGEAHRTGRACLAVNRFKGSKQIGHFGHNCMLWPKLFHNFTAVMLLSHLKPLQQNVPQDYNKAVA